MKKSRGLHKILREPNPVWGFSKSPFKKKKGFFLWDWKGLRRAALGDRGLFLAEETVCSRKCRKVRVAGVWRARKDGGMSGGQI